MKRVSGLNIDLREITVEDTDFIYTLRRDEKKSRFLHAIDVDKKKQLEFIKWCLENDGEYYFVIESKEGEALGAVRIYDIRGDSFCWGSWIIKDGAPLGTALESVLLVYDFGFNSLNFPRCHFDVRKSNRNVLRFHDRFGAWRTGETAEDILFGYDKQTFLSHREALQAMLRPIKCGNYK